VHAAAPKPPPAVPFFTLKSTVDPNCRFASAVADQLASETIAYRVRSGISAWGYLSPKNRNVRKAMICTSGK